MGNDPGSSHSLDILTDSTGLAVACVRARPRDRNSGTAYLCDRNASGPQRFGAGAIVWYDLTSTCKFLHKQDNVGLTRETASTRGPAIVNSHPRRRGHALYLSSLLRYRRRSSRVVHLDFGRRIAHHVAAPSGRGVAPVRHRNFLDPTVGKHQTAISTLFDQELNCTIRKFAADAPRATVVRFRPARAISEKMLSKGECPPISL